MAALLLASLCGDADACVLTDSAGRWEPLFGYYRPSVLPRAAALLASGRRSMGALLASVSLREVSLAELGEAPDSLLARNVNVPEDYEKLRLELGE